MTSVAAPKILIAGRYRTFSKSDLRGYSSKAFRQFQRSFLHLHLKKCWSCYRNESTLNPIVNLTWWFFIFLTPNEISFSSLFTHTILLIRTCGNALSPLCWHTLSIVPPPASWRPPTEVRATARHDMDVSNIYSSYMLDNVSRVLSSFFTCSPPRLSDAPPYSILIYNKRHSVPDIWIPAFMERAIFRWDVFVI